MGTRGLCRGRSRGVCAADADSRAPLRKRKARTGQRSRMVEVHTGARGRRESGLQSITNTQPGNRQRYQQRG